jgi:hypothetical protein
MLYLEVFADLLTPSFILLGKMADCDDVLFDRGVQLLLENCENVSGTDKPVPVSVIEHKRNQMSLSQAHFTEFLPEFLELLEVDIGLDEKEMKKPSSEIVAKK